MAPTFDRLAQRLGALFALFGVILGALAAHKGDKCLYDFLERKGHLEVWHTALFYQWVHALALLAIGQGQSIQRRTVRSLTLSNAAASLTVRIMRARRSLTSHGVRRRTRSASSLWR